MGIPLFKLKVDDNGCTYIWQDGKKFYLATCSNNPGPELPDEPYPQRPEFESLDEADEHEWAALGQAAESQKKQEHGAASNEESGHEHSDDGQDEYWQNDTSVRNLARDLESAASSKERRLNKRSRWVDDTTKYLMGLDGADNLTEDNLGQLRLDDIEGLLVEIQEEHASIMANWITPAYNGRKAIIGPDIRKLLHEIEVFLPLVSTKLADVIDFISQFSSILSSYSIAVMPFEHIALEYGDVGLCYPGVGKVKFKKMAEALAKLLYHRLIPVGIDKTGELDDLLTIEKEKPSPNGYAMLWALLELFVDAFKPDQVQVTWPDFTEEDNIFTFTRNFTLTWRMSRKREDPAKARNVALLYLQKVDDATGHKYKAAVLQLRSGLESLERNAVLPDKYGINRMCRFIARSVGKEAVDLELTPAIRRVQINDNEDNIPDGGTHILNASGYRAKQSRTHEQIRQMVPPLTSSTVSSLTPPIPPGLLQQRPTGSEPPKSSRHLQGFTESRYEINQAYRQQSGQQSRKRPTPNPKRAMQNPKKWSTFDPETWCEACGKRGHPACRCYALAMAILIRKYMDADHYDVLKECEDNWVRKHEPAFKDSGNPQETPPRPLKVLRTFMERNHLDIDDIDNELDWEHFREDYGYPGGEPYELNEAGH
jgi:hypothetical protein